ncbi:hypothetical protein EV356DRAFT_517473 [Viridothelium virens]|uniref:Uncharacterized protein n=1 Tax=Viridothelium virens TaxID=1048519 RepID=A0A6A6H2U6_VIRVR|nr:hypothetical protein EV356DRAFT_517473 [Viridothelium virens]
MESVQPWKLQMNPGSSHRGIPCLSLKEFKEHLTAITHESTDDEIFTFHLACMKRGTDIFYLGSKNEIDYGIYVSSGCFPSDLSLDEWNSDDKDRDLKEKRYPLPSACSFYRKSLYYTGENQSDRSGATGQPTTQTPANIEDVTPKKPDLARLIEIGSLLTYSNEEKWSWTRFEIVKSLDDNRLWIVATPEFPEDFTGNETEFAFAEPESRTFPLEGFQNPISCARLNVNVEGLEYDEGMQHKHASRTIASKLFDIDQEHSGGFVIRPGEKPN